MDSTALAYWLRPEAAITIDYGHLPAPGEIRAANAVCTALNIEHHIIHANVRELGSGDLAGSAKLAVAPVPEWWPFRNQFLITVAAMKAVALQIGQILIGILKTDRAHSDGGPEFVSAMNSLLWLQEGNLTLKAPAIELTATELIKRSGVPMEVLAWAHSCHTGEYACGTCRGCRKHYETLRDLGENPY